AVVGTPGVLRPGESHLALAPQLPGLERPEVLRDLRDRLACPVVFDNDVNLAAIGEMTRGAGPGVRDFVMISSGPGLGMAVVPDPALVILGGGIGAGAGQLLVEPIQRVLERISPLCPRFAVSELGSAAVLDGAVTEGLGIVMDEIFQSPNGQVASVATANS